MSDSGGAGGSVFPSNWSSLLSFITSSRRNANHNANHKKKISTAKSQSTVDQAPLPSLYNSEADKDKLILLGNGMSQPSRAVMWFLEVNRIPYEFRLVRIMKGQHLSDQYATINPMRKVPVIIDHGDVVFESHTILRYLSQKYNTPDHWYPRSDLLKRTRIDSYLDWHHLGFRKAVVAYIFAKSLGRPYDAKAVARTAKEVQKAMDILNDVWLMNGKKYLMGEEISIADLSCVCELMQLRMVDSDLGNRPQLQAYVERMAAWPGFEKVHKLFFQFVKMKKLDDYYYQHHDHDDIKKAKL